MPYGFKDPSSLLRPWPNKDIQFFAEELYALLVSSESIDIGEEPQDKRVLQRIGIPKSVPEAPLQPFKTTIESRTESVRAQTYYPESPSMATQPSRLRMTQEAPPPPRPVQPRSDLQESTPRLPITPQDEETYRKANPSDSHDSTRPLPETYGDELEPPKKGLGPIQPPLDIGNFANGFGGGGGTNVFMGTVQSGTGATYEVTLYQDGPDGTPDSSPVEVTIPQIDPNEKIPAGTWLTGIISFTDSQGNTTFACQVPIWLE
jgi:hypothetical protein